MSDKQYAPEVEARFNRIIQHLPEKGDLSLIALKGHLLAEESLTEVIVDHCVKPSVLEGVDMGFYIKARIARGLFGDADIQTFWPLLDKLNSIRNEFGHKLESPTVRAKIKELVEMKCRLSKQPIPSPSNDEELGVCLGNALAFILGKLAWIERSSKRRKVVREGAFKSVRGEG